MSPVACGMDGRWLDAARRYTLLHVFRDAIPDLAKKGTALMFTIMYSSGICNGAGNDAAVQLTGFLPSYMNRSQHEVSPVR